MGVLGLTPFIQKTCPEVIQTLPGRFRSLAGKKIVIDGTLITQRFHFAPIPHPHKHVLCWYRLARHLQASNVQVICVFDGRERSAAKEREVERRRRDRMVTAARGVFEIDRLSRLRRLTKSLRAWQVEEGANEATPNLLSLKDLMQKLKAEGVPIPPPPPLRPASPQQICSLGSPDLSTRHLDSALTGWLASIIRMISDAGISSPSSETGHPLVPKDIAQLYVEYQQSVPQIMSLAEAYEREASTIQEASLQDIEEARIDYGLSKSQHGLIMEEGKLWEQLANSEDLQSVQIAVKSLASTLEAKSSVLSESYARRTNPPTSETYEQSRDVLRAMGIPCIEPSGPYEAEALAASLVLNGYADYVASEDTDVLIYEAPLVRNVATGAAPLVLISGSDVRTVLQLDRARFIDFALLLGTDFSQRIKNVGPARALKFIREHGSIERVIEREVQYPPRIPVEEYLQQIALARSVFNTLPPTPDASLLQQGVPDESAVWAILDKFGLHRYVADDWEHTHVLSGNYFADNPAAA
ncbi:PIN domain-like protein [Trametes coccinea BRFM310]|uniref:PIN domain-like protein n=1 Tax=Trametes coccinea (strain BRFM310) TaxID=1353009 RepID=A0A1Y2IJZ6_TRAC3|nr:PIN domain-like protein [Trametes coccinea BRFM310]